MSKVERLPDEPIIIVTPPNNVTFENARQHETAIRALMGQIDGHVYLIVDCTACRISLDDAAHILRDATERQDYLWYDKRLTFIFVAHFSIANLFRHAWMRLPIDRVEVPMYETVSDALEFVRSTIGAAGTTGDTAS